MSQVRIASDPHFGHENIAIKRGFANANEQDEHIISEWNKIVKKRDVVWILGDITMENHKYYYQLDRLNGQKKIVLGNHDKPSDIPYLLNHVSFVCGIIKYKKIWLSHAPIHPTELRNLPNIHGHVHHNPSWKLKLDKRYFNVCLENINYQPPLFEEIKNKLK